MELKFIWKTLDGSMEKTVEAMVGESILKRALLENVPVPHACEGACACATCHVIVDTGFDSLDSASDREEDMLDFAVGLTRHSRLCCQLKMPNSPLTIQIPKQNGMTSGSIVVQKEQFLGLDWKDTLNLAQHLFTRFPNQNPIEISFPKLTLWCKEIEGFLDSEEVSEKKLEAIQQAWVKLFSANQ